MRGRAERAQDFLRFHHRREESFPLPRDEPPDARYLRDPVVIAEAALVLFHLLLSCLDAVRVSAARTDFADDFLDVFPADGLHAELVASRRVDHRERVECLFQLVVFERAPPAEVVTLRGEVGDSVRRVLDIEALLHVLEEFLQGYMPRLRFLRVRFRDAEDIREMPVPVPLILRQTHGACLELFLDAVEALHNVLSCFGRPFPHRR